MELYNLILLLDNTWITITGNNFDIQSETQKCGKLICKVLI